MIALVGLLLGQLPISKVACLVICVTANHMILRLCVAGEPLLMSDMDLCAMHYVVKHSNTVKR
jgi:hypothetical protein